MNSERNVFVIDVGDLSEKEAKKVIEKYKKAYKDKSLGLELLATGLAVIPPAL